MKRKCYSPRKGLVKSSLHQKDKHVKAERTASSSFFTLTQICSITPLRRSSAKIKIHIKEGHEKIYTQRIYVYHSPDSHRRPYYYYYDYRQHQEHRQQRHGSRKSMLSTYLLSFYSFSLTCTYI